MLIIEFCKTLVNNDEQICSVCNLNNPEWHKYELPCKHHLHTRCCRKHFFEHGNKLNCPICGKLWKMNKYRVCIHCEERGHADYKCPEYIKFMKEQYE